MIGIALNQIDFHIPVTPLLVFSLFGLLLSAWLIYSMIMRYHWKNYSVTKLEVLRTSLIYFTGSGILLFIIGACAILYAISS